jgi:hypothetical protein
MSNSKELFVADWEDVTSTEELFEETEMQGPSSSTSGSIRVVKITITNKIVGKYEARSYPHDDINGNGKIELYEVDVYEILIEGFDAAGNPKTYKHIAPRFMPYWNNPKNPDSHYKQIGWVNAGLSSERNITVVRYLPNYEVRNRYSPGKGAIVLTGAFYIHAGPADVTDFGFGSAGCVEIIGNYDDFKSNIQTLSGISGNVDAAISSLVSKRKLKVTIRQAKAPNIQAKFTREV